MLSIRICFGSVPSGLGKAVFDCGSREVLCNKILVVVFSSSNRIVVVVFSSSNRTLVVAFNSSSRVSVVVEFWNLHIYADLKK